MKNLIFAALFAVIASPALAEEQTFDQLAKLKINEIVKTDEASPNNCVVDYKYETETKPGSHWVNIRTKVTYVRNGKTHEKLLLNVSRRSNPPFEMKTQLDEHARIVRNWSQPRSCVALSDPMSPFASGTMPSPFPSGPPNREPFKGPAFGQGLQ